ncbi:hypothetical protein KP509_05G093200 [Ceratopteris richardii]|nr:hypothetical protein KP509_05G093200 [Ceratopteris richardii]
MDSGEGDGLVFVIAPSKVFNGKSGAWLGLSDKPSDLSHTVAIEFDASMDTEVQDPSGKHIGFDLESLVSMATAEVSDGFSLREGEKFYAWIDYIAPAKVLEVRLSRSEAQRPQIPLLSLRVDLAGVWQEDMYVGFTSSSGKLTQRHILYSWSFISGGRGMWGRVPSFRADLFGDHGPYDWHHGEWQHGPHHWHHGPHDWHHGPNDWPQRPGHDGWHHEGFPYMPENVIPHEWHPDHPRHHHIDHDGSWFDDLDDVWGVVLSLLLGVACGTFAAGVVFLVWFLIRRFYSCETDSTGFVLGYQNIDVSDLKEGQSKISSNGYQKVSTSEPDPDAKTVSV